MLLCFRKYLLISAQQLLCVAGSTASHIKTESPNKQLKLQQHFIKCKYVKDHLINMYSEDNQLNLEPIKNAET